MHLTTLGPNISCKFCWAYIYATQRKAFSNNDPTLKFGNKVVSLFIVSEIQELLFATYWWDMWLLGQGKLSFGTRVLKLLPIDAYFFSQPPSSPPGRGGREGGGRRWWGGLCCGVANTWWMVQDTLMFQIAC